MKLKTKYLKLKITSGFTLIELMIVIGIISILSIGVLTILNPADQIQKANDARRKSDLLQIQKALEQYYEDNGRYPPSSSDHKIVGTSNDSEEVGTDWGSPWVPYMNLLPKDPSSPSKTYIYSASDGQSYYLYASLDRGAKDKTACNNGNACNNLSSQIPAISDNACSNDGNDTCNYGVSSPNTSP